MTVQPKPSWVRARLPNGPRYQFLRHVVDSNDLHTVCQSAMCPNMGECWSRGTATLMILGDTCTRSCTFCAVQSGRPMEPDLGEPARVARAVAKMGLKHAVITSVARDDLSDGGSGVWAATIRAVRNLNPETAIEVLIPDFQGSINDLDRVLDANPNILNHNMETVRRLQRTIRKTATYERTLGVLQHAKSRGYLTKSGIMLGIGEKKDEISDTLLDLRKVGVEIITIGQYLRPSLQHAPVDRWVTPDEFHEWHDFGMSAGFGVVESGPLVRSSYHAEEQSERYGHSAGNVSP